MREPTCPVGINFHEMREASVIPCAACEAIRDAYQRGREDERREIAEAIFNEEQEALRKLRAAQTHGGPSVDMFRNGLVIGLQRARDIAEGFQRIAAARGDGEPK